VLEEEDKLALARVSLDVFHRVPCLGHTLGHQAVELFEELKGIDGELHGDPEKIGAVLTATGKTQSK
jgi:hypothetical protein